MLLQEIDIGRGSEALYRDQLPGLLQELAHHARVASITASSAIEGVVVPEPARAERLSRAGRDACVPEASRSLQVTGMRSTTFSSAIGGRSTWGCFCICTGDGNGRVARAVTNALLADAGYSVVRYVSLEQLIADSADSYYDALLAATHDWHEDGANPWPWLTYFAQVLATAYRRFGGRAAAERNTGTKQDRVRTYVACGRRHRSSGWPMSGRLCLASVIPRSGWCCTSSGRKAWWLPMAPAAQRCGGAPFATAPLGSLDRRGRVGDVGTTAMTGLAVLAAALVLATGFGLWRRWRDGRSRPVSGDGSGVESPDRAELLASLGVAPGDGVTLLQFSSAFCAPCRATRVTCARLAGEQEGVRHVEVDAESHLAAVRELRVWRTPTVFVVDSAGRLAARITGQPTAAQLREAVATGAPS